MDLESRDLVLTYEIKYFVGTCILSSTCYHDVLVPVLEQLVNEGKQIYSVESKWI